MTSVARPGGRVPEHLWVASDDEKTVVAVLAPPVAGSARHEAVGPVTVVSPDPVRRAGPSGLVETLPARVGLHTPRSGGAVIGWSGAAGSAAAAAAVGWVGGLWVGLLVAVAGVGVSVWLGLRRYTSTAARWAQGYQVITHYDDRAVTPTGRGADTGPRRHPLTRPVTSPSTPPRCSPPTAS
jgi:hypothetical protein